MNILIIEDLISDQDLLLYHLNRIKTFHTKANISETMKSAEEALKTSHYDAILLDLNLPDSSAINTLNKILKTYRNIPTIIMTTSDPELEKQAIQLGAQDFLDKHHLDSRILEKSILFSIERQKFMENLLNLSFIDPITNQYNFKFLMETYNNIYRNIPKDFILSLYLIDIRNFNEFNLSFGHELGDALLTDIGIKLKNIPYNHYFFLARGSGTQYYLLTIQNYVDLKSEITSSKLTESLMKDFKCADNFVHINFKITRTDVFSHKTTLHDLINECEFALHEIKLNDDIHYNIYHPELNKRLNRKRLIGKHLSKSIEKNELYLVYQPVVNIENENIDFCETRIRWNCKDLGFPVYPDEFIPIAEETGFIKNIGLFVISTAIDNYEFFKKHSIIVSINLSVNELDQKDFAQNVIDLFELSVALPQQYVFEITEHTQFIDSLNVHRNIYQLIEYGFTFSIDDFGTGYSTFQQIARFSGSIIKIDKSFIQDIEIDNYNKAIISAIANMGKTLGITVVAEGVETLSQLNALRTMNINYIQGYYFYKPMVFENLKNIKESV